MLRTQRLPAVRWTIYEMNECDLSSPAVNANSIRLPAIEDICVSVNQRLFWRMFVLAGFCAACCLAALMLARRLAGGFVQPLSPFALVALGIMLSVCFAALRASWYWLASASRFDRAVPWSCSFAGLAFALAFSLPGSSTGAMTLLWIFVLVGECLTAGFVWRRPHVWPLTPPVADRSGTQVDSRTGQGVAPQFDELDEDSLDEELLEDHVIQRLVRTVDEHGGELVFGLQRVTFAAGERQQNIHVAFCPPLASTPKLSMDVMDGPSAETRVLKAESYGAAIEVRLSRPSDKPVSLQVHFAALGEPV